MSQGPSGANAKFSFNAADLKEVASAFKRKLMRQS